MPMRPHIQNLVGSVRSLPPLATAFVFPCDREALELALAGTFAGHVAPLLVGPEARIRDVAVRAGLDIAGLPLVDTADDPRAASHKAVALAREGRVRALVKGSLSSEHLLAPIAAPESGLRSSRRLSYAHILDVPGRAQLLIVADALLNIAPTLAAKKDILLNTLDLARALGVKEPRVALLSAVDSVNYAFASSVDAAALKSMARQGLFGPARLEGPMTADSALSPEIARSHGLALDIAGTPDILLAPTMESASLMLRTTTALTGAFAAGVVLGARIPIVMFARNDPLEVRIASCVLATLLMAPRASGPEASPNTDNVTGALGSRPRVSGRGAALGG